jgi:hypothetical protein
MRIRHLVISFLINSSSTAFFQFVSLSISLYHSLFPSPSLSLFVSARVLERATVSDLQAMFPSTHHILTTNCPLYKHLAINPNLQPRLAALGLLNAQPLPLPLYPLTGASYLPAAVGAGAEQPSAGGSSGSGVGKQTKALFTGSAMDVKPYSPGYLVSRYHVIVYSFNIISNNDISLIIVT